MKIFGIKAAVSCGLYAGLMVVPVKAQVQDNGSAQESVAANSGARAGAAAVVAASVSAELTQSLNSRNAKVGDTISARTRSAAQISNGTKLQKGTKLLGKVTAVQAKSGAQRDGHLVFVFDRAVLKDGQEVPIRAVLRSLSAPTPIEGGGDAGGMLAGGAGAVRAGAGGDLSGARPGSGGLGDPMGGVRSAAGGAASSIGGATRDVAGDTGGVISDASRSNVGLVDQTSGVRMNDVGGGSVSLVPVMNLPGITASGSTSATGVLNASGRNVELNGGTQMVLAVSAN